MTALATIVFAVASVLAALYVAHRDDRRHDRSIDDIIARRYTQPRRIGSSWNDGTISAPRPGRNYGLTTPTSVRNPLAAHALRVHASDSTPAALASTPLPSAAGVHERDDRPGSSPAGVNNRAI